MSVTSFSRNTDLELSAGFHESTWGCGSQRVPALIKLSSKLRPLWNPEIVCRGSEAMLIGITHCGPSDSTSPVLDKRDSAS